MTLPKKGTRKIKVDGKDYRWRLSNTQVDVVVIEDPEGNVKTVGFPQENPEDERYEYAPILPSDVVLAIRFTFLKEKVKLPSFEERLARHRAAFKEPTIVELRVESCDILRPRGGTDKVILELAPDQAKQLLFASVGAECSKDVWDDKLHCQFDITKGAGEKLAKALGLEEVNVIEHG